MKHLNIMALLALLVFVPGLVAAEQASSGEYTFEGHVDEVNINKLVIGISTAEFKLSPSAKAYDVNNSSISLLSLEKFTPVQATMRDNKVVKVKILPDGYNIKSDIH